VGETAQRCEEKCTEKSVFLQEGELSSFQARKGDAVVCLHGAVWLTQSGDSTDYVLQTGERFVAARSGKVVIQALSAAHLCVPRTPSHD
jgi:hypothetical protein